MRAKQIYPHLTRGIIFGLLVASMILLQGCSSIIAGSTKDVQIISKPSGAKVEVYNWKGEQVDNGTTPFTVSVKRGSGYFKAAKYEFKGSLPGHQTHVVGFKSGINSWYWGNLLLGGVIGMLIVDPITGAMWQPPDEVLINFSEPQSLMIPGGRPDSDMFYDRREWTVTRVQHSPSRE